MKRLLALVSLAAAPAFAQCVMCFRTAAAQQAARARVLDLGILLLGGPPFLILAGFCFLFWRRNHTTAPYPPDAENPLVESERQDQRGR
jgi:hypothetical protein